jgi:hypothetical protein
MTDKRQPRRPRDFETSEGLTAFFAQGDVIGQAGQVVNR